MIPVGILLSELSLLLDPALLGECEGRLVAAPRTTEEVSSLARYANTNKLTIDIVGSGTKRAWGNAVEADLVLDMSRLTGIREHAWQDLTTTVAAGTTWSTLQRSLATQNQRVALDPLWPESSTVGGIVASNDSGVLRSRYGSLRDLIIGMTIVLADGTIAHTGGKVVKNVAGYDLHKLMTGAFGTLGLITEVTFRLHPCPKAAAHWTALSDDVATLERIRHRVADSTIAFESLQMRTCNEGFALDVALVSVPGCMEELSQRLHQLAAPVTMSESEAQIWTSRERMFRVDRATVKITVSPNGMAGLLKSVRDMGGAGVVQQCGIMMATLTDDAGLVSSLRQQAVEAGGALTILHWPGDKKLCPDVWGSAGSSLVMMQEIKRKFDPNRIFNPGRFVGGI